MLQINNVWHLKLNPMRCHLNLNRLGYFTAVVEQGSFTAAADLLGVTKAVVSQQVAKLEQEVGVALLVRTTRKVHVTEAGESFYLRCTDILRDSENAFAELALSAATPTGTLRITAPLDYGMSAVVPAVGEFTRRYPDCTVSLTLSDQKLDPISARLDMAIRVGWLMDSSLRARRIASFRQLLVCAPALVRKLPRISAPENLAHLPFVANAVLRDPLNWKFTKRGQRRTVSMQAAISIDATIGVYAAVLGANGFSVLPDFLVSADLASGRLVHALSEWSLPAGGVYAVFPAGRFRSTKVTAFVEILMRQIGKTATD